MNKNKSLNQIELDVTIFIQREYWSLLYSHYLLKFIRLDSVINYKLKLYFENDTEAVELYFYVKEGSEEKLAIRLKREFSLFISKLPKREKTLLEKEEAEYIFIPFPPNTIQFGLSKYRPPQPQLKKWEKMILAIANRSMMTSAEFEDYLIAIFQLISLIYLNYKNENIDFENDVIYNLRKHDKLEDITSFNDLFESEKDPFSEVFLDLKKLKEPIADNFYSEYLPNKPIFKNILPISSKKSELISISDQCIQTIFDILSIDKFYKWSLISALMHFV